VAFIIITLYKWRTFCFPFTLENAQWMSVNIPWLCARCISSWNKKSSCGERHPVYSTTSGNFVPSSRCLLLYSSSCQKPRKGAIPVPGPTRMRGSLDCGILSRFDL